MRTTIDSAGRIIIHHDIRAAAGLRPGTVVELAVREGVVSIEPAPASVRIVKRGRLRVAVPEEKTAAISEEEVRAVREEMRSRR